MKDQKKTNQEMYAKRRKEKLCLWCGKPLDREGSLCIECNEKNKERSKANKDYYLKMGICPYCRKRKITSGYKSCFPCREQISLKRKQESADPERKGLLLQREKEKRKERLKNGLCTKCGKNKPENGYRTCAECRRKVKKYRKTYITKYQLPDRALWKDQGRCSRCGAEEQYEGFTLCKKCYEQSVAALEKARSTVFRHRAEERARQEEIEAQKQIEVKKMFHPRSIWERRNENTQEGDKTK